MSSRNEVTDPNTSDLPLEAFEPIQEGQSPNPLQLEARIRAKREGAQQDAGDIISPHHAEDIEPITPPEEDATVQETEDDDQDEEEQEGAVEPEGEGAEEDSEDEEGESEDEEGPPEDDDFFVGRYRTKEEAEEGIAEKDRTIRRIFREQIEREREREEQPEAAVEQRQIDPGAWRDWATEAVESAETFDQRVQAANVALQNGGVEAYDIFIAAWIEEDPAQAVPFNNEVVRQQARLEATRAAEQRVTPPESQDEALAARARLSQKYTDVDQVWPEMDRLMKDEEALDPDTRQWLYDLAQDGVTGKTRALDYLYRTASAMRAPRRDKARREETKKRRASADRAKVEATVSSSEGAAARTPLSEADAAIIDRRNRIREKAGIPLIEVE